MRRLSVLIVLGVLLGACVSAHAQVLLEEGKIRKNVVSGENFTGKLTVHNTSDAPETMKVYWEDFIYTPPYDGSKNFLPKGAAGYSLSGWVNVSTRTLEIPPFSKKDVTYTVNVPDDFNKGHYGVLFFEKVTGETTPKTGMNIISRAGSLFFIEPKNKIKTIQLENFRFSQRVLKAELTNRGNVIIIPDGTFYVIDEGGMAYDRGEIKKVYLPPQKTTEYTLTLNRDLDPGTYTLVMTLDLEDDDVAVREIDFEKSYSSEYKILAIRE